MKIGVYLLPGKVREPSCPGHMSLWWLVDKKPTFRGFHFKVKDLPLEYQPTEKWRDYLFDHAVPGYVSNDLIMHHWMDVFHSSVLERSWPLTKTRISDLDESCSLGLHALYSFNPDDHFGAFNCVTWAVEKVRWLLGPVLPKVRQGRIKLMAEELLKPS